MVIRSKHKVEELTSGSVEIGVEIKTGHVMGSMSSGEAQELSSRIGDDGSDSDKRGAESIRKGR